MRTVVGRMHNPCILVGCGLAREEAAVGGTGGAGGWAAPTNARSAPAAGAPSLLPLLARRLCGFVGACQVSASIYPLLLEALRLMLVLSSTQLYTPGTAAPPGSHPFLEALNGQPELAAPLASALLQVGSRHHASERCSCTGSVRRKQERRGRHHDSDHTWPPLPSTSRLPAGGSVAAAAAGHRAVHAPRGW